MLAVLTATRRCLRFLVRRSITAHHTSDDNTLQWPTINITMSVCRALSSACAYQQSSPSGCKVRRLFRLPLLVNVCPSGVLIVRNDNQHIIYKDFITTIVLRTVYCILRPILNCPTPFFTAHQSGGASGGAMSGGAKSGGATPPVGRSPTHRSRMKAGAGAIN